VVEDSDNVGSVKSGYRKDELDKIHLYVILECSSIVSGACALNLEKQIALNAKHS
ncbi:hypothetical protein Tco_1267989, partial [Tanacetum coccineum]